VVQLCVFTVVANNLEMTVGKYTYGHDQIKHVSLQITQYYAIDKL